MRIAILYNFRISELQDETTNVLNITGYSITSHKPTSSRICGEGTSMFEMETNTKYLVLPNKHRHAPSQGGDSQGPAGAPGHLHRPVTVGGERGCGATTQLSGPPGNSSGWSPDNQTDYPNPVFSHGPSPDCRGGYNLHCLP